MNSTYQSIDDLSEWFKVEPRTKRWDAMLAFDQSTVNTLLLQQYIERFNGASYLPPVNTTIDLGNGSVAEIRNYVFDQPRLSFENANLDAPTATLRMQGLGGVRLNWNVSGSNRKLESISYEYPVNGDVHESIVKLTDKSASVRDKAIIIDVAAGDGPLLKFGATLNEKKRAGEKVKSVFQIEPPLVREYVLSELKAEEGSLFKPEHILLLTQPAPDSRALNSVNYGDGAVLVFVAFEGGSVGDKPFMGDPDWRYLLNPGADGHSAMMVVSQSWMITKFMRHKLQYDSWNNSNGFIVLKDVRFEPYKPQGSPWVQLKGLNGEPMVCQWLIWDPMITGGVPKLMLLGRLTGQWREWLTVFSESNSIKVEWEAGAPMTGLLMQPGWGRQLELTERLTMKCKFELYVSLNAEDGLVVLEAGNKCGVVEGASTKLTNWIPIDELNDEMPGILVDTLSTDVRFDINTLHLSSILLGGDKPIRLKGADIPGDLVMYGDISNERTGLVLNQLETLVGAGATFEFLASGAGTGAITWSLEKIDGEANDAGSITPAGLYTAPQITSTYARVRLTAKRGDYTTQALITVARELAAISPAVQLAVVGAGARYFVRGGASEAWEWDTTGLKGQLVTPVPEPGDEFEPGDMQYIPPATIDTDFILEQIKIKVGNNITSSTIVVTKGSMVDIAANLDASAMSATLTSSASGMPLDVVYTKVAGAGALNGNVVTSEATPAEPYIVIQAKVAALPFAGYLLLPLPLSVLEGSQSLLMLQDPSLTFDCSLPEQGYREVNS